MSNLKKTMVIPSSISIKSVSVPIDVSGGASTGAVGSYSTGVSIPPGSHIIRAYLEKIVAFAGSGATIALSLVNAGDLLASATASSLTNSINPGVPTGSPTTFVKNTGSSSANITYTVASAPITAGTYNLYVEYK